MSGSIPSLSELFPKKVVFQFLGARRALRRPKTSPDVLNTNGRGERSLARRVYLVKNLKLSIL
jgi:hypothetical protein